MGPPAMGRGAACGSTALPLLVFLARRAETLSSGSFLPASPFLLLLLLEPMILPSNLKLSIYDLPAIAVFLSIKIKAC